jgi:hypothetical protein
MTLVCRLTQNDDVVRHTPKDVNLRWWPGDRGGRACLSETAGPSATKAPSGPMPLARNSDRPNGVQLHPRCCGLGETRPTSASPDATKIKHTNSLTPVELTPSPARSPLPVVLRQK